MAIQGLQKHQAIYLCLGEAADVPFGLDNGVEFHMLVFELQYGDCVCSVHNDLQLSGYPAR